MYMSCHDIGRGMNEVVKTTIELYDAKAIDINATKKIIASCAAAVNWCDGNEYEATAYIRRCPPNGPQKNLTQRSQTAHAGKYAIKQEPHVTTLSNASIRPSSLAVAKVYTKASAMRNNSNQPL